MKLSQRLTAAAIAITIGASLVMMPTQAKASQEGRRNTALAIGAAALALIISQSGKHHRDRDYYSDYRYDNQYSRRYDDDCRDNDRRYYQNTRYRDDYRYDRYDRYDRGDYRYSRYDDAWNRGRDCR
jgi:hypothetical protein